MCNDPQSHGVFFPNKDLYQNPYKKEVENMTNNRMPLNLQLHRNQEKEYENTDTRINQYFLKHKSFLNSICENIYKHKNPNGYQRKKKGELSSFQALSATISASAGIGNVAGSAAAVSLGGPGVIFWMIIAGFFSMALKFSEVLLGVKFRNTNPDGSVSGGPMYYILVGLRGKYSQK